MALVRRNRGRWVADFRDQHQRRRIEAPQGPFDSAAFEKRAAEELLQQRLAQVRGQTYLPDHLRPSFRELAQQWLASKVRVGHSTREDYETMLECYLLPYFGPRKMEAITRYDIERFRAALRNELLPDCIVRARDEKRRQLQAANPNAVLKPLRPGPRTINKCLGILVSIFGYAQDHKVLVGNVAARIDKLRATQGDESRVIAENILAPQELSSLMAHAADPYRIPIALAVFCGLRIGEVVGLKWSDIDWAGHTAKIQRQQRRGVFFVPKTRASQRTIELPGPLLALLKDWQKRLGDNEQGLVCPSVLGKPMQGSALLQRGLRPALQRAGLRAVRFHDLRHSFASNLLEAGVNIVTVSKALGHANVQITLTIYASAVPKARQGASDRMATLVGLPEKVETKWKQIEANEGNAARSDLKSASQLVEMAERVGFEPTNTREDVTGIPVQRLRPLGHLSAAGKSLGREGYTSGLGLGKRDSGSLQGVEHLAVIRVRKRGQGKPDTVADQAHSGEGPLGRNGV